ncbi:hypothetical protein D3C77_593560 [compost metagenome]
MIATGRPINKEYKIVLPRSAPNAFMAIMGAGWGGTSPCTVDRPAKIGIPICRSDIFVFRATVNTIGISKMRPTSKNTGIPTIKPTIIIAQ